MTSKHSLDQKERPSKFLKVKEESQNFKWYYTEDTNKKRKKSFFVNEVFKFPYMFSLLNT